MAGLSSYAILPLDANREYFYKAAALQLASSEDGKVLTDCRILYVLAIASSLKDKENFMAEVGDEAAVHLARSACLRAVCVYSQVLSQLD